MQMKRLGKNYFYFKQGYCAVGLLYVFLKYRDKKHLSLLIYNQLQI